MREVNLEVTGNKEHRVGDTGGKAINGGWFVVSWDEKMQIIIPSI